MVQQVKGLVTNSDNMNSILRAVVKVEGVNLFPKVFLKPFPEYSIEYVSPIINNNILLSPWNNVRS